MLTGALALASPPGGVAAAARRSGGRHRCSPRVLNLAAAIGRLAFE